MKNYMKHLIDQNSEFQFLEIIVAIFAVLVTIVLFVLWKRRRFIGNYVLLTGLCDAGKTLIYVQLMHNKYVQTHTSIKENIGDILKHKSSIKIVDIPGHERLRYKYFDKFKKTAKALVFIVDSATIEINLKDAAEFLYTLLSDPAVHKNVPILILCNKQDQCLAKSSIDIKNMLENEMNLLRLTKSNQLDNIDASSSNVYLGITGYDFLFSHLDKKIEFAECSAFIKNADTEANLKELTSWLTNLA